MCSGRDLGPLGGLVKWMVKPRKTSIPKRNVLAVSSKLTKRRTTKPRSSPDASDLIRWRRLLMSPCDAQLSPPPYAGSDSGYLIRTTDIFTIASAANLTSAVPVKDAFVAYTPWNVSTTTGIQYAIGPIGTPLVTSTTGLVNFITSSGSVKEYRPVAACFKWIPTGAVNTRSGAISLGYSSGVLFNLATPGSNYQADVQRLTQRTDSNGSAMHEINWLPAATDENWTTTGATSQTGCGTIFISLTQIDATSTGVSPTIQSSLTGYLEITTCWEWIPVLADGVSIPLRRPNPYPLQTALASLGDPASAIFAGAARMVGRAGGAALAGLAHGFLRSGLSPSTRRIASY